MQLGWVFIALAIIFIIVIIFLLIWAFKEPYTDDTLRKKLINSTINNKQALDEHLLAMRYGMTDNMFKSKSLRNDVKTGYKVDVDLLLDMVNAINQSDNEKIIQLRDKWNIYADEMASRISLETKVDKTSLRKLMEDKLVECLNDTKQMIDAQAKQEIKEPTKIKTVSFVADVNIFNLNDF